MSSREPLEARAERFLAALRAGDRAGALRLAERDPELASGGIACASALGDADAVSAALADDAASAATADAHGATPLLYACASPLPAAEPARGEAVTRCVELLLDHGADPNTYILVDPGDPHSRVPALFFACVADQPRVVRLLLERGADPNDGESIYHAAELNREECMELLLAHGADLSSRHSHWGNTPLYFLTGYLEDGAGTATAAAGIRWLLEQGADPNVTSYSSEETLLHRIAERGRRETAELLLAHGADPDRLRADGRTPYVLALRSGNQAVADLLLERGADPSRVAPVDAFLGACLRADETAARDLLARRPGLLDELSEEERGALGWAVQREREASVRLMAALGFGLAWGGPEGGTPLHQAAWQGMPRMVRLLLELGAPVDDRDSQFGSSPLGWAARVSELPERRRRLLPGRRGAARCRCQPRGRDEPMGRTARGAREPPRRRAPSTPSDGIRLTTFPRRGRRRPSRPPSESRVPKTFSEPNRRSLQGSPTQGKGQGFTGRAAAERQSDDG